jgi:hypothetical protein
MRTEAAVSVPIPISHMPTPGHPRTLWPMGTAPPLRVHRTSEHPVRSPRLKVTSISRACEIGRDVSCWPVADATAAARGVRFVGCCGRSRRLAQAPLKSHKPHYVKSPPPAAKFLINALSFRSTSVAPQFALQGRQASKGHAAQVAPSAASALRFVARASKRSVPQFYRYPPI